jgi:hypothetical protein
MIRGIHRSNHTLIDDLSSRVAHIEFIVPAYFSSNDSLSQKEKFPNGKLNTQIGIIMINYYNYLFINQTLNANWYYYN